MASGVILKYNSLPGKCIVGDNLIVGVPIKPGNKQRMIFEPTYCGAYPAIDDNGTTARKYASKIYCPILVANLVDPILQFTYTSTV